MKYISELKPKAIKDLKSILLKEREQIVIRIERMEDDLNGLREAKAEEGGSSSIPLSDIRADLLSE